MRTFYVSVSVWSIPERSVYGIGGSSEEGLKHVTVRGVRGAEARKAPDCHAPAEEPTWKFK